MELLKQTQKIVIKLLMRKCPVLCLLLDPPSESGGGNWDRLPSRPQNKGLMVHWGWSRAFRWSGQSGRFGWEDRHRGIFQVVPDCQ